MMSIVQQLVQILTPQKFKLGAEKTPEVVENDEIQNNTTLRTSRN